MLSDTFVSFDLFKYLIFVLIPFRTDFWTDTTKSKSSDRLLYDHRMYLLIQFFKLPLENLTKRAD